VVTYIYPEFDVHVHVSMCRPGRHGCLPVAVSSAAGLQKPLAAPVQLQELHPHPTCDIIAKRGEG